jgi:hypothetical protein
MAAKGKKTPSTMAELGAQVFNQIPLVNPDKKPVALTVEEAHDPEAMAKKLLDEEAEQDIQAQYDATHNKGFEVVGLAMLLHSAACRRFHSSPNAADACPFEGLSAHPKFNLVKIAQARALWIEYATDIANLSGTEAARKTLALVFGKGEFERLGKGRYHTKEERAAYEAKKQGKQKELDAFLESYTPGQTGDDKPGHPTAADQQFHQTYAGGTVEQVQEEVEKANAADIAAFLGEPVNLSKKAKPDCANCGCLAHDPADGWNGCSGAGGNCGCTGYKPKE